MRLASTSTAGTIFISTLIFCSCTTQNKQPSSSSSPSATLVPLGGIVASNSPSPPTQYTVPVDGNYIGTVKETILISGGNRLFLGSRLTHISKPSVSEVRLRLGEYPDLDFVVSPPIATKVGLYLPEIETVEDARGWKVRIHCKNPPSGSECAVLSLEKVIH